MPADNVTSKKLNVLVYSGALTQSAWRNNTLTQPPGNGSTVESVRHCLYTLRRLLAPNYAVIPVTSDMIIKEPWTSTCAMLVMPGGADLGYCKALNGQGNRRISQFVQRGGAYLGFCAGGYYGSKRCEWEVGDKNMEVIGERELAFFPGTCRGCAFPGFVYHSEAGARAAELEVFKTTLNVGAVPDVFRTYYNGGGVFVDAPLYADRGVEVLASYTEELHVDPGEGAAAVVYCKVGDGAAILTGPHPEFVFPGKLVDDWELIKSRFAAVNLNKSAGGPEYGKVVDRLAAYDKSRTDFLKACLTKLGLQVTQETTTVPSLSCLHLSASEPEYTANLVSTLNEIIVKDDDKEYLKDDNDTFLIERSSKFRMEDLEEALPRDVPAEKTKADQVADVEAGIVDYNSIVKRLLIHNKMPSSKLTPYWNHHAFYSNLRAYQTMSKEVVVDFGRHLLYGEVITSTNTILEK
jgi:biotin--protein ligase